MQKTLVSARKDEYGKKDANSTFNPRVVARDVTGQEPANQVNAAASGMTREEILSVETIMLPNRNLYEVPECVMAMQNATRIYLNGNNLETLPNWLWRLEKLELVLLDNNRFTTIPEVILGLPNLRLLSMDNNDIRHVPERINLMPQLDTLFLYNNNRIDHLPYALMQCVRDGTIKVGLSKREGF